MALMREFLTTGRLGEIQLGLRPEQVTRILGAADDQSARHRPVLILRYGTVEFTFMPVPDTSDSKLVSISLHFHHQAREIPPLLRPTDWIPTNQTTEVEFYRFLEQAGIPVHSSVQGEQDYIVLCSGASAVFVNRMLHSIHFKRGEKPHALRQLTVTLPEDTAKRLKQRARDEGLSVGQFIEEMIRS